MADFYRHKRHDLVLEAWAKLEEPRPPLHLLGDPTVDPGGIERSLTTPPRWSGWARCTFSPGSTPRTSAPRTGAPAAFVLASECESFNLPLLEAQACGLPTVVRDLPALWETGGGSTVHISGDDPDEWTAAIQRAQSAAAGAIDERAVDHAASFTWPRSAAAAYEALTRLR